MPERDGRTLPALVNSQMTFYELRAPDYGDRSKPSDRLGRDSRGVRVDRALMDEFRPEGDVLEIACGTGSFTAELVRHARSVTALDSSPSMLALNAQRVGDARVRYLHRNVFTWVPDRLYDVVFFANWLSHVPPSMLDEFWGLVRLCLGPGGRVGFVDETPRASALDETQLVGGVPTARRTLGDGRQFDVVKVFWDPADLRDRLRALGWAIDLRPLGETCMFGSGRYVGTA